jgi:hypothetical protein
MKGSHLEEAEVQLHPYIINLIAQDQMAQMRARAASDRLARAAARRQKDAKRHGLRDRVHGHRVPAQPSSPQQVGHPALREDRELISVGRAGSDDCA